MYTILVCDDNSLVATVKQRIMQRSKLVDDLWILVPPTYNEQSMSDYTVNLEYTLPCSRKYRSEILELSNDMYNNHLKYILPVDTKITSEAGSIEAFLTFVKTELDEFGNDTQRVRKTSNITIDIIPVSAWADIIPDEALSALDQRLIKLDAQMRGLSEFANDYERSQVDGLTYNNEDETLQLTANGVGVGDKVSVRDMLDDGVPIVELGSIGGSVGNPDSGNDNSCDCGCMESNDDDVVEF